MIIQLQELWGDQVLTLKKVRRSGFQLGFQVISKVFSEVKVRTLESLHSIFVTPCLHGAPCVRAGTGLDRLVPDKRSCTATPYKDVLSCSIVCFQVCGRTAYGCEG